MGQEARRGRGGEWRESEGRDEETHLYEVIAHCGVALMLASIQSVLDRPTALCRSHRAVLIAEGGARGLRRDARPRPYGAHHTNLPFLPPLGEHHHMLEQGGATSADSTRGALEKPEARVGGGHPPPALVLLREHIAKPRRRVLILTRLAHLRAARRRPAHFRARGREGRGECGDNPWWLGWRGRNDLLLAREEMGGWVGGQAFVVGRGREEGGRCQRGRGGERGWVDKGWGWE